MLPSFNKCLLNIYSMTGTTVGFAETAVTKRENFWICKAHFPDNIYFKSIYKIMPGRAKD